MNKLEYLDRLENLLLRARLPKSEIDDIMRDYAEYFEEGHRQGQSDSEISAKLGSPETVAQQLIEDSEEEKRRRREESRRQAQEAAAQRREQLRQTMQQAGEGMGNAWKRGKQSLKEAFTLRKDDGSRPQKGGLWQALGRMLAAVGHALVWCMGLGLSIIGLGGLMCFCVGLAMGLMGVWLMAGVVLLTGVGMMILTGLAMSLLSSLAAGGVAFFSGLSVSALGTLGLCLAWKLTRLFGQLLFLIKELIIWLGRRFFDRAPDRRLHPETRPQEKETLSPSWPKLTESTQEKEGMSDETQW